MKKIILIILLLVLGGMMLLSCSEFGTRPKGEALEKLKSSANYNREEKIFQNRRPHLIKQMRANSMNLGLFIDWFAKGVDRVPSYKLPEVKPDLEDFLLPSSELKVIWFGHTTFLLNMSGKIILVDPVFSGSASPFSFMVKRFQPPVLQLNELPEIDFVLISHDHYDHLDMESIKYLKNKDIQFITPLGVGSHLRGWGVQEDRIIERDWWQELELDGIKFIATPAQHFSGRDGIHDNVTLWASWVIQSKEHNIYFSGDSGYDTHFKDIGDKYGPFDIAFIETGQYNDKWKEVHMLPEDAAQAYFDLKARRYFPVHWGMFELSFHTWYDPVVQLTKLSEKKSINLVVPKLGELVQVNEGYQLVNWWCDKQVQIALNSKDEELECSTL